MNKPVSDKKCARGKCKNKALKGALYCGWACYLASKPKSKKTPFKSRMVVVKKGASLGPTNPPTLEYKKGDLPKYMKKVAKFARRSKKRAAQEREYLKIREDFLLKAIEEGKKCPVYPDEPITDVHHKKGRIGKLLTDVRYFLPVSRRGHDYIEAHPAEAYKKGWSLKRNAKTE